MKKIISLLLLLSILTSVICSCEFSFECSDESVESDVGDKPGQEPGKSDEDEPEDEYEYGTATVFMPGDTVMIITEGGVTESAQSFKDSLDSMLKLDGADGRAFFGTAYTKQQKREVLIGLCDPKRPASVKAHEALEVDGKRGLFELRYAVYAEAGCIAFAYENNNYTNHM